jgi:hypothetical protein
MNEIALIRAQLAAEKTRAMRVAEACLQALEHGHGAASATQEFRSACVDYLARVLAAFEERDQLLAELLRAPADPDDESRQALERSLALEGGSREALQKLERAGAAPAGAAAQQAWKAFAEHLVRVWGARRDALDAALLAANTSVSHWRAIGAVDADSILAERRGYACLCALLPAGIMLPPATAP